MEEGSGRGHSAGGAAGSRVRREGAWAWQGSLDIGFKVRARGHERRCPQGLATVPGGRPGSEQRGAVGTVAPCPARASSRGAGAGAGRCYLARMWAMLDLSMSEGKVDIRFSSKTSHFLNFIRS